ncbi:MAG: histidine kinase dimerization/phosphoacceptor domain-containing protein [Acidimicrobiales bacterium]
MTHDLVAAAEEPDDRPYAPGRPRFEALLVAAGLVVQVGMTLVASRHQPQRRDIDGYGVALLALAIAALPLRRRCPVGVLAFAFVATQTYFTADYPRGPIFYALVFALAQVVLTGHRRAAIASIVLGFVGFTWLGSVLGTQDPPPIGGVIGLAAWLIALLSVMELVRSRRERAREEALSRAESLQRRASDERLRIAQELHDAVAHNISLINIHAGVALHLFDEQPQQARDALATIK